MPCTLMTVTGMIDQRSRCEVALCEGALILVRKVRRGVQCRLVEQGREERFGLGEAKDQKVDARSTVRRCVKYAHIVSAAEEARREYQALATD
jgi:hypothetical protein